MLSVFQARSVWLGVVDELKRTNLSGSRLSHQRGQFPGNDVTGDIVQQSSLCSTANRDSVVQTLPREGIGHLLSSCQCLFGLCIIAAKIVDRVRSSGSGGLYVARLGGRGLRLCGSALECDNRPSLGEFGLEFGDDEVSSKESDPESDRDTKVLETGM